ncbi:uncharacterized protein MELLADRAFT_90615 [Melampsora larici-populina 98AG31]|uniref:Uncharacterized protein n=1 Tax=Melampsora larici-populina (strain 98AG31 / pathotype 3-4-7) TaxID=747676 RepID=F4RXJ1_MELLP|nr:uncharacterized protein MELLADRAFT_90615 [Melampsora larici-populina 98AG31]EGG02976.1 hypothetical protein MELLADRAFT_90615 [Melampsora larici-populina 98AG31]
MGEMNWPKVLVLHDIEYHIVSRGFWSYNHYWCKLVRHVDGARGIWFFDDRKDDGRAQLIGRDSSLIAGAQPSTSWLIYARKPTGDEQKLIDAGIAKTTHKNPEAVGDVPFVSPEDLIGVEDQMDEDTKSTRLPPPLSSMPPETITKPVVNSSVCRNKAKEAFAAAKIKTEPGISTGKLFRDKGGDHLPAEEPLLQNVSLGQAFTFGDIPDDEGERPNLQGTDSGQSLRLRIKRPAAARAEHLQEAKKEASQPKAKAKAKAKGKKKK